MARCIAPSSHLQPDPGGVDGDVGVTVHTYWYVSIKWGKGQQRRNLFQLSISIGYSYVEIRVYISFFRVRRVGEFSDGASPVLGSCCMLEISEN